MASDPAFHFPPDIFDAVVDAIPLITRSKGDVLLFFRGCGLSQKYLNSLEPWTHSQAGKSKYHITREVLRYLNETGDTGLGPRREVLKRVAGFDNFSSCYPDNQLKAKGAVAAVAELVNRKDSFTRMQHEYEDQLRKVRQTNRTEAEKVAAKSEARDQIKRDFYRLFGHDQPQGRGTELEDVLNRLFALHDILVREAFTVTGESGAGVIEQIDGDVEIDVRLYLVEMKWWTEKLGRAQVAPHLVSVYSRGEAGGIFISSSGYHESAVADYKSALAQKTVVLVELQEIVVALERGVPLLDLLRPKIREATLAKRPLFRPLVDS